MIDNWLNLFKKYWISYDISSVIALFDPKVEYWETPNDRLFTIKEIIASWNEIKYQNNIELTFNSQGLLNGKHTVWWHLKYMDKFGVLQSWQGTYIIELNNDNKCIYFLQNTDK